MGLFRGGMENLTIPLDTLNYYSRRPASVGGGVTWTKTDNPAGQNTGTNTVTFSSAAIGSPSAGDLIIANFSSESAVATSATVGGNSMIRVVNESTTISGLNLWKYVVTGGDGVVGQASATFVFTSGGGMTQQTVQIGKLAGANSTETNTGTAITGSVAVTVPTNGIALVGIYGDQTGVWTNATGDYDTLAVSASRLGLAHASASATVSNDGIGSQHMVYMSFGP